ncbi:hypothetical protein DIE11_17495 [Burkholderia sp. Bp9012]|uniref:hypothetical protein n=1 Tax=Burkholderia sp. Bp9012 TaxID=2184562 RepID=UPI000F5ABD6B|nr:hypothetical protein [Burkholderia sp. Bp9012]RQR79247.1 hypothetical protein DIE11_17495 [Burkholderia sp. Bp9012]
MAPENCHAKVPSPLFKIGALIFTEGVNRLIDQGRLDPWPYFQRHARGDWGEATDSLRRINDAALSGDRLPLLSLYKVTPDITLWVVTTRNRDMTIVQLPDECEDD